MRKIRDYLNNNARDLGHSGKDPVFGWGFVQVKNKCSKK